MDTELLLLNQTDWVLADSYHDDDDDDDDDDIDVIYNVIVSNYDISLLFRSVCNLCVYVIDNNWYIDCVSVLCILRPSSLNTNSVWRFLFIKAASP